MVRAEQERKHKKHWTKQMDIRDGWGLRTKRWKRPHCIIQIISTDEYKSDTEIRPNEMGWKQDNRNLTTQEEVEMTITKIQTKIQDWLWNNQGISMEPPRDSTII
eukprot:878047-Ditylum_brightwellii.AAC.1